MAQTVIQGFQELSRRLEITDYQSSIVSTCHTNIRDTIRKEMTILDHFLTGSYIRNTMIAPLSQADIDIFIVLHPSYFKQDGQRAILDKVKGILQDRYTTTTQISRNGQAVTMYLSNFEIDVVPAFERQGGGYLIPDSTLGQWIGTNPKSHISIWSQANAYHNRQLIPLLKMIKGWNKKNGAALRSFHLECINLKIWEGNIIPDYPSAIRYVFNMAQYWVKNPLPDPAGIGYNANVGKYLNTVDKINDVVSRLQTAYTRASNAEDAVKRGNFEEAFRNWRLIFDDYFPAYS